MDNFYRYFPKVRGGSSIWSDGSPAGNIIITETFGAPVGTLNVDLPLLTNTSTFFAPTIVPGAVDVSIPLFSNTNTLYSPTISPGAVAVTLPLINSTNNLFAPIVAPGAVNITTPLLASTTVIYSHTVSPQAVSIALPLIASGVHIYSPVIAPGSVNLTMPLYTNTSIIYEPRVTQGQSNRIRIVRNSRITKYAVMQSGVFVLMDLNSKTKKVVRHSSTVSTEVSRTSKITIKKTLQSLL